MNPRERVLAALNHQEPDRVPVDLSGHRSSGISPIAYARLREYLGLPKMPLRVYDVVQQLVIVDDDVLDLFGVDTIELGRGFALRDEDWREWVLPNGAPCLIPIWFRPEREASRWILRSPSGRIIGQMPDGALYFEQTYHPYADGKPVDSPVSSVLDENMWTGTATPPGPLGSGPDGYRVLAEGAKALRQRTDRAIIGLFGGNLLEMGQFLFRNDNFFLLLAGDPEQAQAFLEEITEMHLANLEKYLSAVGPYIDIILFGDDLGMQTGPQISPRMYHSLFKPYHERMWKRAKELAPVKVMLHCCGGIRELLPDLIDAGLDTFNPVQIASSGMDARGLKDDFGQEIAFWGGGCDTQDILPNASPDEVRKHVREQVQILKPGGGFIFQQVHNIQADIPPENIVAMLESVNSQ